MAAEGTARAGTPERAADFVGMIGVDTHIPYTDGGYSDIAKVGSDLAYLGVSQLRDGITDGQNGSAPFSSYLALAKQGEKFTFVVGSDTTTTASVQAELSLIAKLNAAVPGSVTAVEGPNEINNESLSFDGQTGEAGALAVQKLIYSTVKSDPALTGVAVDYFTGYDTVGYAAGPDPSTTRGLADYDTQHPYPHSGQAPAYWVSPDTALGNEPGAKGKFVYTETGYSTNASSPDGVSEAVQAKYELDLLFDAAKDGASHVDLYELMDAYKPGSAQGDAGFGLFDSEGAAKPAATAIHDLTTILSDTGAGAATFTPTSLAYVITGLPSTGNGMALAKSNGDTDVVVWAEPAIYDESSKSDVQAPAETATVSLDGQHDVEVYDPLSGTTPVATYHDVSSVQVRVTDHPLVVQVSPAIADSAAASPSTATDAGASTAATASPSTTTDAGSATVGCGHASWDNAAADAISAIRGWIGGHAHGGIASLVDGHGHHFASAVSRLLSGTGNDGADAASLPAHAEVSAQAPRWLSADLSAEGVA